MERVSINEVLSGMKSALTIYNANGLILVDAGAVIGDTEIEKLKKEKVPGLYICDDTVADIAYPFLLTLETRISFVKFLKQIEKSPTQENKDILVNNYLNHIIDILSNNEEIEVVPPEIRPTKSFEIFYKVNTCIISLLLGIKMGLTKDELISMALNFLLLKNDQFEDSKLGLSLKLKEIIHVVKDFDLMVSGKDFNKSLPCYKAINNIVSNKDKNYKREIVELFVKIIAPYPLGTRVKLNTGDIAVVMDINKTSLYKPIVRIMGNQRIDNNYNEIDLLKHDSYVIVDVIF